MCLLLSPPAWRPHLAGPERCAPLPAHPAPLQSCGIQSEVCDAVLVALPALQGLRALQLALRRALPAAMAGALAAVCAQLAHLAHLDAHLPGYTQALPAVPAWRQLSALTGLRHLHASTGLGWDGAAFVAVAAAATGLRAVTLTDNSGAVDAPWAAALAPLRQLSDLRLNSCTRLGRDAVRELCRLTSLTSLQAFRWAGWRRAAAAACGASPAHPLCTHELPPAPGLARMHACSCHMPCLLPVRAPGAPS